MSGIFGVFRRDGAPVEEDTLTRMQQAMSFWGPDGAATWRSGPAGLGHLLRHNTPEARYEAMPIHDEASCRTMTAAARLDNYTELCDQFEIPAVDRPTTPDGRLVLLAYERWGEECVDHLFGDWSFAVWDAKSRCLFLARDHHGQTSLYTYAHPHFFVFASSLKALLALPEIAFSLNELRLAQVVSGWIDGDGIQTVYSGVNYLPPAHRLKISADQVDFQRYWYLENTPLLHLPDHEAYVEGLLFHFGEAVRARLRSHRPVGTTLSGGLDSGAVTVVAANLLAEDGKELPAFGAVPCHEVGHAINANRIGDEGPLMSATAAALPNVMLRLLRSEHQNPLHSLERGIEIHDQPLHSAANLYWVHHLCETARDAGIGVLLTGQMGNGTISWMGRPTSQPLAALLKTGQWKTALKHHLIRWMPRLYHFVKSRNRDTKSPRALPPLLPDFVKRVGLYSAMRTAHYDPLAQTAHLDPLAHRMRYIRPGLRTVGATWAEAGAFEQLDIRDPTADVRLMTFCISIPDRHYIGPDGSKRYMIKSAMSGHLPDVVLHNQRQGYQAADISMRLFTYALEVEVALADLNKIPQVRQILDLTAMQEVWMRVKRSQDHDTTNDTQAILLKGIMAGRFLTRLTERYATL